jgi:hypothetical protein
MDETLAILLERPRPDAQWHGAFSARRISQ